MLPIQPDLYRSFSSMKQQRVIYYSPLDEYQPLQGYPPEFHQASLTVPQDPFKLLGGKSLDQKHNTMTPPSQRDV